MPQKQTVQKTEEQNTVMTEVLGVLETVNSKLDDVNKKLEELKKLCESLRKEKNEYNPDALMNRLNCIAMDMENQFQELNDLLSK